MLSEKTWIRILWTGFVLLALYSALTGSSLFSTQAEVCEKNHYTGQKECADHHITLVGFIKLGKFLDDISPALTAFATLILAIFTWRLWWSTDKLWKEATTASGIAKQSADAATKQFTASNRPWIEVGVVLNSGIKQDVHGQLSVEFLFQMKNVGNGVAQYVSPNPDFFAGEGFTNEIKEKQLQIIRDIKPIAENDYFGQTIFPDRIKSQKVTVGIPKEWIEKYDDEMTRLFGKPSGYLPRLFLVGSVHYKSTFSNEIFQTGFICQFGAIGDNGKITQILNKGAVTHGELVLASYFSGDGLIT